MYEKIIFPIDLNDQDTWETAFPVVVEHAKRFDSQLHVMTVVPDYGMLGVEQYFPKGWLKDIVKNAETTLEELVKKHVPESVNIHTHVGRGAVYQCIIDTGEKLNADLIIMAANRPALKEYLLGPNAAKVVRHAKVSVLIVRDNT